MRNVVLAEDLQGLAEHYDEYAQNSLKEELKVIKRVLRSGQHAARQHREKTGALVEELCIVLALYSDSLCTGDADNDDLIVFEGRATDVSVLDQCAHPAQKAFMTFLGKFHSFCVVK
jgi:hypothetical protein